MSQIEAYLRDALKKNHIHVGDTQFNQFILYLALLEKWNRVFNLTNITAPLDMVYLHLIDSLLLLPFLSGQTFLDVGTGAGLPGLPLAIMNPKQQWTLLDKNGKKTRFLTQVVLELQLPNITIVQSRTEDFHPTAYFDSILSRAFATLDTFTQTTAHLLCAKGYWLAMKGKYPQDEIAAIRKPYQIIEVKALKMQGMAVDRHIVLLSKGNLSG